MAERMTLVCDRNARGGHPCPNEAHRYEVTMPDGTRWQTDLCDAHGAVLEEVRTYGSRARRPAPKRKTFRRTEVRVKDTP